MKVSAAVKKTTMQIAAGTMIGTGVMLIVFAMLGKLDYTVVLGAVLGMLAAVGNFFLMGMTVQRAAEESAASAPAEAESAEEEKDEPESGTESSTGSVKAPLTEDGKRMKKRIQISYSLRMVLLVLVSLCAALIPCFNVIAYAIPLIFPRLVISCLGFRKQ